MDLRVLTLICIFYGVFFTKSSAWFFYRQVVDCKVKDWSQWSACDNDCRGGIAKRERELLQTTHRYNDVNCRQPLLKEVKNCPSFPCPVDCVWGPWSQWSKCDTCLGGRKSRVRNVELPAMFGGKACQGSEFSVTSCRPYFPCVAELANCSNPYAFRCLSKDECVEGHLKCNVDFDCRDRSDEHGCESVRDVCLGKNYATLPNGYIMGAGYDILRDSVSGQVLDNKKYKGVCETILVPEVSKEYRKPYNLQMYRSYIKTHTTLNSFLYEDTISLSNTKVSDFEHSVEAQPSVYTLGDSGSNAVRTHEKMWKKIVDSNAEDDYSYVKIESKIELGHFKTRRGELKVSHYFAERLRKLPRSYDAAVYFHFLSDFGTHYFTEGKLGGVYQVFYQFKSYDLEHTGSHNNNEEHCYILNTFKELLDDVEATMFPKSCTDNEDSGLGINTMTQKATDSISTVLGGYSFAAAELTYAGKNALKSIYKRWADTVPKNPTIFDYKIAPISELVQDFGIRQNIDRALQDLYAKYDPKKCRLRPCLNDGKFVIVNKGRECKCICKSPFYGKTCERKSNKFPSEGQLTSRHNNKS